MQRHQGSEPSTTKERNFMGGALKDRVGERAEEGEDQGGWKEKKVGRPNVIADLSRP